MHGKALQGNRNLPVQKFISLAKTRLMGLGVNNKRDNFNSKYKET